MDSEGWELRESKGNQLVQLRGVTEKKVVQSCRAAGLNVVCFNR